jgi:hypothetical protein
MRDEVEHILAEESSSARRESKGVQEDALRGTAEAVDAAIGQIARRSVHRRPAAPHVQQNDSTSSHLALEVA